MYPHQDGLPVCRDHIHSPKPRVDRLLSPFLKPLTKVCMSLSPCEMFVVAKGSGWSKLVWEQVVSWRAANDVPQVWDCMICCYHHHIHETIWHHLLLTHPMSIRRAVGRVEKEKCVKEEITLSFPAVSQSEVNMGSEAIICRFILAIDHGPGLDYHTSFILKTVNQFFQMIRVGLTVAVV